MSATPEHGGLSEVAASIAVAGDVLPDGRVDHRGHLRDDQGTPGWVCTDCSGEDEPGWIDWTIPYDVDGKPIPEDWRTMPYAVVLALCGMPAAPDALSAMEYRAVHDDTGETVGVGITDNRDTAEGDALAWQRDGYAVSVQQRACGPWHAVD